MFLLFSNKKYLNIKILSVSYIILYDKALHKDWFYSIQSQFTTK